MTNEKWQKLSFAEQMANIGSELNRVIYWHKAGDRENKGKAVWRVLELIDLTIADKRWASRLLELIRLREVFCDLFLGKKLYDISLKSLQNYFLNFALAARR